MSKSSKTLTRGAEYEFKISNKIAFPGDDKEVYILIGPDERKYLLNASYYDHYNLNIGDNIICHVDKINCTGQIFLEPRHPYYLIGSKYKFYLDSIVQDHDPWGNIMFTAKVIDKHNKIWSCQIDPSDKDIEKGSAIDCIVERIKKADISLASPKLLSGRYNLLVGSYYHFKLIGQTIHDEVSYYILEDSFDKQHLIRKDYYLHYNFVKGQNIRVHVVDRWPDMSYKLEPDNPYYRIGNVYDFKFIGIEFLNNPIGDDTGILKLEDKFGIKTEVKAHDWQISLKHYDPKSVRCKVIRFKKGKLQLENLAKPLED